MKKTKTKSANLIRTLNSPFRHLLDQKNEPLLHTVEWLFVLFSFFIIGFSVMYSQESSNHIVVRGEDLSKEKMIQTKEDEKLFTGEVEEELVDTTDWDNYQNKWYGYEIHHPDSWKNNTQYKTATEKSAVYETIYKFRKDEGALDDIFEGYDVKIYPVKKVQALENTNDIHKKEGAPEDLSGCKISEEVSFGQEETYFQEVSIKEDDPCYEPAYFYSITKGDYIYNIVPAVGESGERFSNPEKETSRQFPEYQKAVASFKFIPIVRPKPKADPRIGVRRPVSAKIVNGKLVCAKKNDKPGKSHNNKPGHLDLECCLDPDERPNPWCTY